MCPVLCCASASDLLGDPRRFVVMSIESKLLVLVPTLSGQMVAICPKHVANSQDLTNDVVQTIMAVWHIFILRSTGCNTQAMLVVAGCAQLRAIYCLNNSISKLSQDNSLVELLVCLHSCYPCAGVCLFVLRSLGWQHPRLGCPSQDVDGGNHLRSPSGGSSRSQQVHWWVGDKPLWGGRVCVAATARRQMDKGR
jgi:hypothetical protein